MIRSDHANQSHHTEATGSMSGARASISSVASSVASGSAAVQLLSSNTTVTSGVARIDMSFSTDMAKGAGYVYVTDGAVQTVVDRVTQLPTIRIVGATQTLKIAVADLQVSGNHVVVTAAGLAAGQNYSVFMGEGALLSSSLRPFSGVTVPGAVGFNLADQTGPTLVAMELSSSVLSASAGAELTLRFSEAVDSLPAAALQAPGLSISSLQKIGTGTVWKATLGTVNTSSSTGHKVSLDMSMVRDVAGNAGSGSAFSPSYMIDDAKLPTATIELADTTLQQGEQVELTIRFSEPVTSFPAGALQAPGAAISGLQQVGDGSVWKASMTTASTSASTGNKVSLDLSMVRDAAGNAGAGSTQSPAYAIDDNKLPTATLELPDTVLVAGEQVELTIRFSEPVVTLPAGALQGPGVSISGLQPVGDGSVWKATVTATATVSSSGNVVSLDMSQVRDAAGAAGSGSAYTPAYKIDDNHAPTASIAMPDSALGVAESVWVTVTFSEKVSGLTLAAFSAPHVTLSDLATTDGGKTWQLVMTADTPGVEATGLHLSLNLAGVVDNVGTAASGTIQSPAYSINTNGDTEGPVLQSVVLDGHALDASHAITATISFDEAVRADDLLGALDADGATLSDLASSDGGKTWTVKLTALSGSTEPEIGSLTLDMGSVRDIAGNYGYGYESAAMYSINSTGSWMFIYDNGAFDDDNLLGDAQRLIYGVLEGDFPSPETTFELSVNGSAINQADFTLIPYAGGVIWMYADEGSWTAGAHTIVAKAVKSDTSVATITKNIEVDLTGPSIVESPASGSTPPPFDVADSLVIVFDEAVYFSSSDRRIAVKTTLGGVESNTYIVLSESDLSADHKTLTVSAASHLLASGATIRLDLPWLEDVAGNPLSSDVISFTTTSDSVVPTAQRVYVNIGDGTARAGETIEFRMRFSEAIKMLDTTQPSLGLSNGKEAQFSSIAGNEMLFQYTVAAGEDATNLHITDFAELPGHVGDLAGNALDAAHIEFSGLYTSAGYGTQIDIDTVAPGALAKPQLDSTSDTGIAGDFLTSERFPVLRGTGAEAWAEIELYEGDALLGTGYADDNGAWYVNVAWNKSLADGLHQLTVKQLDDAGNRSAVSPALGVTVDGASAAMTAPRLDSGYDTGISSADNITKENQPVLTGSGAEAGASIKIYSGDTQIGYANADSAGNWSAGAWTVLSEGEHEIFTVQLDSAGNTSSASAPLYLTIDRTGPGSAPPTPLLAALSDTGISDSDGITNDTTPTFSGVGALANSEIALFANEVEVGRTVSDALGNWSITVATPLADNSYGMAVQQFDVAGNKSVYSDSFNLKIDTGAPTSVAAATSSLGRTYTLSFSEQIVFAAGGNVDMVQNSSLLAQFVATGSNWTKPSETELSFNMSTLQGLFQMQTSSSALQDVAGNVAIVGTAHLEFTMPGLLS